LHAANSQQKNSRFLHAPLDWQGQSNALVGMTELGKTNMKAHLTRRYRFSASHRLHSEQMSDAENQSTYGKCNNPHGHGHNYVLEVTVSGQVDESTGMICNLVDLDECVQREIVTRFDLENLNMKPEFADSVPTTENLCTVIYDILKREFGHAHLERVRMEETMMNSFEYQGIE
jgi:6-pyruvoyltetrahydropterin/6-carboxytetrahydropterin synthase